MSKLIAAIVAAMFAVVTTGAIAASHTGGAPMADGQKSTAKKTDKAKKTAKAKKTKKAAKK